MLLSALFYNGIARWQFGFDNPNRLAVFAVEVLLVGLALSCSFRRLVRVAGIVLSVGSLYVLLHTFSRGGIVALMVAVIPFAILILRRMRRARVLGRTFLAVAAVGACALAFRMGVVGRLVHGFSGDDRSVGNRLELWRAAPLMIHDAPFGWGIGNSGKAYMQWYQPIGRHERYRTLVNSHLTWIVETGFVGGVAWLLGWSAVLAFGFLAGWRQGSWLCWAEWSALFVAGLFSSVGESWLLWTIPGASLVCLLAFRWRSYLRLALVWGIGLTGALGCVAGFVFLLWDEESPTPIKKRNRGIEVGRTRPLFWLLPDSRVLGGEMYPRGIREFLLDRPKVSFVIAQDARQIPDDAEVVVVCGEADDAGRKGRRKTIWLSPQRTDVKPGREQLVIVGGLSAASVEYGGQDGVITVEGASDYIPNWLSLLCSHARGGEDFAILCGR